MPVTLHTPGVLVLKVTVSPDVAVAERGAVVLALTGDVRAVNEIVCVRFGVADTDAAGPVYEALFVAVTVNV